MRRLNASLFSLAVTVLAIALLAEWARGWMLSPDLAWGWAVPFICAYFLWMRRIDLPIRSVSARAVYWQVGILLGVAAFARLWLEPFPGWPLMEWIYSLSILGLLWLLMAQFEGRPRANHLFFPLALGLVAIPWPAYVTERIIGNVRIGLAGLVAELLTAAHWPAVATGTTIETARGSVGIDEACGGIHSLQTAVLVALAVGELRRERWPRRCGWLAAGVVISLFFNTLRIAFLAWECARGGTAATEAWHDTAATAEMLLILAALGGLAMLPGARVVRRGAGGQAQARTEDETLGAFRYASIRSGWTGWRSLLPAVIIAATVLTEVAIALWFGATGRGSGAQGAIWPAHLPSQLLSYEPVAYTTTIDNMLRADHHELGRWHDGSGARREAYILEWDRGQRAQYVLRGHNPDICLGLAGSETLGHGWIEARAGAVPLRFETRIFRRLGTEYYVYFLAWDLTDNVPFPWGSTDPAGEAPNAWSSRWAEIAAHRRSFSARVVAIAVYDAQTAQQAELGFRDALQLITRR